MTSEVWWQSAELWAALLVYCLDLFSLKRRRRGCAGGVGGLIGVH